MAAYDLTVQYTPATDVLRGVATISAHATANLSSFNLDLDGLTVRSITVGRTAATWTRDGGELTITPAAGLRTGSAFTTVVRYDGVPKTLGSRLIGGSGFSHTDDRALVVGEPDVAATWFPGNDHPSDKATYTLGVTVPAGLQVVSNGVPTGQNTAAGWTTWSWAEPEPEPMASYLATLAIGGST